MRIPRDRFSVFERSKRFATALALVQCSVQGAAQAQAPPPTPAHEVVDTLHGTPVGDPYRWLENLASAEVQGWFRAQGAHARSVLDALPGRAELLERMSVINAARSPEYSLPREAGGRWFYTVLHPGEDVRHGYVRDGWTGEERLLVDPSAIAGTESNGATLVSFLPSPDGRLVLYGIADGSEEVVLRVRDVATGRDLDQPIQRNRWDLNQWSPDGRAFFYHQVRDPAPGSPPADYYRGIRIMRHRIGDDVASDVAVRSPAALGADDRQVPFIITDARGGLAFGILTAETPHDGWYVSPLASLAAGVPEWRRLFSLADSVESFAVQGDALHAFTRRGTPRIVRTLLDAPDLDAADTLMVEGEQRIHGLQAALDGLYVQVFSEGVNGITRIPWSGSPAPIDLPSGTSVGQARADPLRSGIVFTLDSWTAVPQPYRYDPSTQRAEALPLGPRGPFDDFEGHTVETVFAPSHDGVRVPLSIVRPKNAARDGSLPLLLIGYGSYGERDVPRYIVEHYPWYEAGGASAVCHVRGGGYYGDPWHQAGRQATKPNTWLDFIACAEFLIREGYTRPERIVARGGSAGGITVGRAITARPDLFAGAVIQNGVLDAVRAETSLVGALTTTEFGSVATEEGFRALHAMSALHHVRQGVAYPAVLLATGLNDMRVVSWQSGKLAAALQAATAGGPVLLRVDEATGHAGETYTTEQVRELLADFHAFAMWRTGMPPHGYR